MKSVSKTLLTVASLILSQTANAAVVERFLANSEKGKSLIIALEEVDQYFTCTNSNLPSSQTFARPLTNFIGNSSALISIHDGNSPLIEMKYFITSQTQVQLLLYTNKEMTSVTRILQRNYISKEVNKGNLAKPNIQTEQKLSYTLDCSPTERK